MCILIKPLFLLPESIYCFKVGEKFAHVYCEINCTKNEGLNYSVMIKLKLFIYISIVPYPTLITGTLKCNYLMISILFCTEKLFIKFVTDRLQECIGLINLKEGSHVVFFKTNENGTFKSKGNQQGI